MPRTRAIAASVPAALILVVGACGDNAPPPDANAPRISQAQLREGRNTFLRTCATCHGANARGLPNNGKDLVTSEFVTTQTDEQLFQHVVNGREVPGGVSMPPRGGFPKEQLTDAQIRDVIVYVRQLQRAAP